MSNTKDRIVFDAREHLGLEIGPEIVGRINALHEKIKRLEQEKRALEIKRDKWRKRALEMEKRYARI